MMSLFFILYVFSLVSFLYPQCDGDTMYVELWDSCYHRINTRELFYPYAGLEGDIPFEITLFPEMQRIILPVSLLQHLDFSCYCLS